WVALAALWLLTIQIRPMLDPDEGRYAEIPREMVSSGDWITPRLDGLKYFEKPALQYWATAALYSVVGVSNWSSRLWTVGLGFACLPLIYAWLARLYDRRAAVAAVAILAMSPYFGMIGHLDLLDASFTFWMCVTILAFALAQSAPVRSGKERDWMLICWAAAALAVLSKGIVVFVLAGGTLIAYCAVERDLRPWRRMHFALGVPLFLALTTPWFILVSLRNADFAQYFFVHEHFQRFLTKEAQRVEPWWYFLVLLALGALPWLLTLGRASVSAWRESASTSKFKPLKFLLIFSAVTLVFFSTSDSKLATYILPMFPPLAAFTGVAVAGRPGFFTRSARVAAGLTLFVAAGLLVYAQRRNGTIPAEAVGWAIAAGIAALVGVAATWSAIARATPDKLDRLDVPGAPDTGGRTRATGVWQPLAVSLVFIFVWQALLCEYAVIPPSRSAYALVQAVAPDVHPGTALYSVGQYRQTIPPYLGRLLTLVDFAGTGELDFGEAAEPERQTATPAQFIRQWEASRDAIAFFAPGMWDHYRRQGLPGRVIARDSFTVAVSRS
ncbi:MAG TPA: phospholipid carrier-dependent glycosyltransferase, partial [Steroidobacteraceae bacterium]|nr:phospholipid carrier-dependent glycosyltransferase [Steroidobacteraceae bacterium]